MSSPNFAMACALKNVKTTRKLQSCHPNFSGRIFKHKAPPWRRLESSQSPTTLCLVHANMQSPTFLHIIIWVKKEEKEEVEKGKKEGNMNLKVAPAIGLSLSMT